MTAAPAGWRVPGHLESRDGRLTLAGCDLPALAHERGTPLFVYSEPRLRDTARRFLAAFALAHPRSTVAFAAKACSSIGVLRILREEGLAVEANGGGEIYKARTAGFAPGDIVFNGVAKGEDEIALALDPAIKAINVDGLHELERVARVARRLQRRARVALRVVPGVEAATSAGNRTGTDRTKFGLTEDELPEARAILRRESAHLEAVGLHAHIGSQIGDATLYAAAARRVAALAKDALGRPPLFVNLGGGFAIPYGALPQQGGLFGAALAPEAAADALAAPLLEALGPTVELVVEPGRALVGDAAVLLSRVEAEKRRDGDRWLTLDAGYNVLIESFAYKWYYHALAAERLDEPLAPVRLAGPLCDSGDAFWDVEGEALLERLAVLDPALAERRALLESAVVRMPRHRRLAAGLGPGDLVAFLDVGAYTLDQLTANNGRPRPEAGLVDGAGGYRLLRRRDSLPDLLHNEVF